MQAVERGSEAASQLEGGFDERLLLKLSVEGLADPSALLTIPELDVVSQEEKSVVAVFSTEKARAEFESRLNDLAGGRSALREDILFAIQDIGTWGRENRLGHSLRPALPLAQDADIVVDAELWPLENSRERKLMLESFKDWCREHGASVLDDVNHPNAVLARIRCSAQVLEKTLLNRDVRRIELPPRIHSPAQLHRLPLNEYSEVMPPPDDAPGVVVLDSGLTAAHPFLAAAVGEAASYLDGKGPADENGHGTMVAGLALYGDVLKYVEQRAFVPELRLFSGRVTDEMNESPAEFLEKVIPRAVEYFADTYGCRVFNVSIGDSNRPYLGSHVGPLAAVLDTLARERDVLFVVSAGNYEGSSTGPADWRGDYPKYLLEDEEARIIDPAPALNALTVGSLARYEKSRMAHRHANDPGHQPIAREGQPSPFSRTGPTIRGAIKPDVVDFGGNWFIDTRAGNTPMGAYELGETSTSNQPHTGNLLGANSGTSFAAPRVAHLASRLLGRYPEASTNLIRALIVAHADAPDASLNLVKKDKNQLLRLVGYGQPDFEAALNSSEQRVTLVCDERLGEDQTHFFEVPIPADFLAPPNRRERRIRVALAHMPYVRSTRLDYKGSDFSFKLVRAPSIASILGVYKKTKKANRLKPQGEVTEMWPSANARGGGTVQAATWRVMQTGDRWNSEKLFVVVTRTVKKWAQGRVPEEPYGLVVLLDDRNRAESRLYSQLRAQFQQRVRPRVRV
ncbi:hypothetical protein BON30_39275 [Cystobacter ferrugineus]|uniref:Peptidase S8/S53 domain-containing protein n=1 Tax=Cystobacter ferrugineus TaxID=83449 RepID=A0A1L9AZ56_9BACT|nr:hypothetical protein BON30_39275 [Cystobacter ferrugineus]